MRPKFFHAGAVALVLAAAIAAPAQTIELVGGFTNSFPGTARGRGNSFAVTAPVTITQIEFRLSFSGTQTVAFYVYQSPVEFGTYTLVHSNSIPGSGTGQPTFYSSGPVSVPLTAGTHAIIATSWSGNATYYYDTGFSQPVSFGWQTHAYADGFHPLPPSLASSLDDSAVYAQRLTTVPGSTSLPAATPVGVGCVSSGGLPAVILTDRVPSLGNASFGVEAQDAPGFDTGYLFASLVPAAAPIAVGGGCFVYLDPTSLLAFNATGLFPITFNASPVSSVFIPVPVPSAPFLAGVHVYLQAAMVDSGSTLGLALTNAIDCRLN